MHALLGQIVEVAADGEGRWRVRCLPVCVLPQRAPAPDWLVGAELTVTRQTPDPREIGLPGDTVPLTPEESARWLHPLRVAPAMAHGLPPALQVSLHWWVDDAPPPLQVLLAGRRLAIPWRQAGDEWDAEVRLAGLFSAPPLQPVTVELRCDALRAMALLLPHATPIAQRVYTHRGELFHAENAWYALDIPLALGGGGLARLCEQGRGLDHLAPPEGMTQQWFDYAGHLDRLWQGWQATNKLHEAEVTSAGARRDADGLQLLLEGAVDDQLRTSLHCRLDDDLPLLSWQRDLFRLPATRPPAPTVPVDLLQSLGLGFHAAWAVERDEVTGSRILTATPHGLVFLRSTQEREEFHAGGWWMTAGWVLVEHPARRACQLYLFDPLRLPRFLAIWEPHTLALDASWPQHPVLPGEAIALAYALTAGELCGANVSGAWVACRCAHPALGVRCGIVASLRDPASATAVVTLGGVTRDVALRPRELPGVGTVWGALVDFPAGRLDDPLQAVVGDIPARSAQP